MEMCGCAGSGGAVGSCPKKSVYVATTLEWLRAAKVALQGIRRRESCHVAGIVLLDGDVHKTEGNVPVVSLAAGGLDVILHGWVSEVMLFLPGEAPFPSEFVKSLFRMGISFSFLLPVQDGRLLKKPYRRYAGGYIRFRMKSDVLRMGQQAVKRLVDITAGLAGCVVTAALLLVLGPLICIQSPGPVLFVQERIGKDGKPFRMYKFRSMYPGSERKRPYLEQWNVMKNGPMFKMEDDPRIITTGKKKDGRPSGIGHFIRRSSLDELPQFFNVLKGDMSLVGPRPPLPDEWRQYEARHRARMSVKPGITGLWQVSGRSLVTDFERIVAMDRRYIEDWSLVLDLKIILKTVPVLLEKAGAL